MENSFYYFFQDHTSLLKCIVFNFNDNKFGKEIYMTKEHFDKVLIIKKDIQ